MKKILLIMMVHSVLLLSMLSVSGCSSIQVYDFSLEAHTDYAKADSEVFELPVALVISEDLKRAEIFTKQVGGGEMIVLGKLLEANSIELTRALFSSVVVKDNQENAKNSGVAAILTPKLVGGVRDVRRTQTMTAEIEWELTDDKGQMIWVTTVEGKGSVKLERKLNFYKEAEDRARKQTTLLIESLFDQSYAAIRGSPEIRAYAEKNGRKARLEVR